MSSDTCQALVDLWEFNIDESNQLIWLRCGHLDVTRICLLRCGHLDVARICLLRCGHLVDTWTLRGFAYCGQHMVLLPVQYHVLEAQGARFCLHTGCSGLPLDNLHFSARSAAVAVVLRRLEFYPLAEDYVQQQRQANTRRAAGRLNSLPAEGGVGPSADPATTLWRYTKVQNGKLQVHIKGKDWESWSPVIEGLQQACKAPGVGLQAALEASTKTV